MITLYLESCADFWAFGVDVRCRLQVGFNKSLTSASDWLKPAWRRLKAPKNRHKVPAKDIMEPLLFFLSEV